MRPHSFSEEAQRIAFAYAVPIGLKILGAIIIWIIGRQLINGVQRVSDSALEHRKVDRTLAQYARAIIGVSLTILLLAAILSLFGVETTSFAGLLTAGGVAIGMAWSGLLSNFAAGVFLVVLRPFKVGDSISAAGVSGTVKEVGLFATTIDTGENVRNYVGNAKIFGDTIQNFTANPYRRLDLKAQLAFSVDPEEVASKIRERVAELPHVVKEPLPVVELAEIGPLGPVLHVRPFCHNDHVASVTYATVKIIHRVLTEAEYPIPEQRHLVRRIPDPKPQGAGKSSLDLT